MASVVVGRGVAHWQELGIPNTSVVENGGKTNEEYDDTDEGVGNCVPETTR